MGQEEKVHIAQIDFVELYRPCFSGNAEVEEFHSQVKAASSQSNEPLVLFHQAARMIWLADRIEDVAAGRSAFQILFYFIAAELVAKTAFKFQGEGQSRRFVRRFFEELCSVEAQSRLAAAFTESATGHRLSLQDAVDFLYDVRCDVVHRGQYYLLNLPQDEDSFKMLIPNGENSLITNLRVLEIRKMILEGAVHGARMLLTDLSRLPSETA